jgi:hypothetical protein
VEEVYTLTDALTFGCACISILPGWWWRSAGGAGSSSHRPARSSGSASVRPLCSLIFGSTNCPLGFEALVRSLLIGLHQAAIVRDIGLEDRREPALTLACQLRIPLI